MKTIECSSGLAARLIEKSSDYDSLWVSSFCHSTMLGLPDNEIVPLEKRVDLVREIRRVSTKPIIVDIDTGGCIEHLPTIASWFADAGAYALIMEDKRFPKQNSLLDDGKKDLEEVDVFSEKIKAVRKSGANVQLWARLESLIAKRSKYEALIRATAYIEAGAQGIMVHSKTKVDATEVMEVGTELKKQFPYITLIAVPTTYQLPDEHPFDVVITANHLTRASMYAMEKFLKGESVGLSSVDDIFAICGK